MYETNWNASWSFTFSFRFKNMTHATWIHKITQIYSQYFEEKKKSQYNKVSYANKSRINIKWFGIASKVFHEYQFSQQTRSKLLSIFICNIILKCYPINGQNGVFSIETLQYLSFITFIHNFTETRFRVFT